MTDSRTVDKKKTARPESPERFLIWERVVGVTEPQPMFVSGPIPHGYVIVSYAYPQGSTITYQSWAERRRDV